MFGLGSTELIIIFLMLLLVFGASRIPALGKGLGEGIKSFRSGLRAEQDNKGEVAPTADDADRADA